MANIIFSEGSGVNDSLYGKSQAPIRLLIESKAENFEQTSILKEVFMFDKSKHWAEKYTTLTAMEGFDPVGENGAYPVDGMQEGFSKTLEHMTWKNSFAVSREMMEDGKILDLRKRPDGFIKSFYRTRENLGAAMFGGAIQDKSNVDFRGRKFDITTADGSNLFSTGHASKVKPASTSSQTNWFVHPFSADALSYVEEKMQNFKGDTGELLNVCPNTIIIPNLAPLKKAVFEAIGADKDPLTSNNGFNFQFGRWNVLVWNYLNQYIAAGSTPWILADLDYNNEYGGAIFTDRTDLSIRSTIDENTDANVWRGYARFTAGFNDWRAFALGGISGGTDLGIDG